MRKLLFLVLMGMSLVGKGNMAEPYLHGTGFSSPFLNKYVEIIHEDIHILPDSYFRNAEFKIEYKIRTNKNGVAIPLIFYANDYKEKFEIWLDSNKIELEDIPYEYYSSDLGTIFKDFLELDSLDAKNTDEHVMINFGSVSVYAHLHDLKYFKANIDSGVHFLTVKYVASASADESDWINEYSFNYSLSPALSWKSFGTLDIYIDTTKFKNKFTTNIDSGLVIDKTNNPSLLHYRFNRIPSDFISMTYKPEINLVAQFFIFIHPIGLMIITFLIMVFFHIRMIIKYRTENPNNRFSKVVIIGSLLVPLIAIISLMFYYPIVDSIIGKDASQYHGYYFLTFLFYPIAMPIYWLIMAIVDMSYKVKS